MAFRTSMWHENMGLQYNAGEYRHLLFALCEGIGGVSRYDDLKVSQRAAGANLSVDIAAGRCYVIGTENAMQGAYFETNEAVLNKTISAADGTNPRNDLIVVRVQDDEYSGAANTGDAVVIPGSPAASPADPSVPANCLRLARVRVNAGATSITNANITDLRVLAPPTKNARGRLANNQFNLDTGLIDTTLVTLNGSSTGINVESPGRLIHIEAVLQFRGNAGTEVFPGVVPGSAYTFHIRLNGANVHGGNTIPVIQEDQDFTLMFSAHVSPVEGGNIIDMTCVQISGGGVGRVQGVGSFIRVYDVGGRI